MNNTDEVPKMNSSLPRRVVAGLMIEELLSVIEPELGLGNWEAIERAGFEVLGSGAYGTAVLASTKEFVIKICWQENDAYPLFAMHCEKNPGQHLPDIFYTVKVGEMFFACMPRYEELSDHKQDYVLRSKEASYRQEASHKPLANTIQQVRQLFAPVSYIDMHLGNFMWDTVKDECVITDPISSLDFDLDLCWSRVSGDEYPIHAQFVLGIEEPEWFIRDFAHRFHWSPPAKEHDNPVVVNQKAEQYELQI